MIAGAACPPDDDYDSDGRAAARADARIDTLFVHAAFVGAIILQRFCLYVGGGPLFVAQILFMGAVAAMLLTGRAVLRPGVTLLLVGFAAVALVSALVSLNDPDMRVGTSLGSLVVLLVLYALLVVRPAARFDGSRVLAIFVGYMRVLSVLGIVQYAAQYAGIRAFSFMEMAPALKPVLAEPLYNWHPVVAYGSSLLRSNGFFLLEPSIFSQLLVLALVVDVFVRRVWHYAPLYLVAHLMSYSGTGLLALAITLPVVALVDLRYTGRILGFGVALGIAAVIGAIALPDQFAAIAGRSDELNYAGSSGYARYVAPFEVIGAVWGETRTLIGYGPGALERAQFYVPGSSSAMMKLFVDYGLIGLIGFVTFLVAALWRREVAILSVYGLVNFQLGGGFLLFPPFIVIMAMLCIWATPAPVAERVPEEENDP